MTSPLPHKHVLSCHTSTSNRVIDLTLSYVFCARIVKQNLYFRIRLVGWSKQLTLTKGLRCFSIGFPMLSSFSLIVSPILTHYDFLNSYSISNIESRNRSIYPSILWYRINGLWWMWYYDMLTCSSLLIWFAVIHCIANITMLNRMFCFYALL